MSGGARVVSGRPHVRPGLVQRFADRPAPRSARPAAAVRARHARPSRSSEPRTAAWSLAVLLLVGAALGTANLFVDGVLDPGAGRVVYAVTMGFLAVLGGALLARRRLDPAVPAVLVVVGDAVYVVVALTTTDPRLYAPPLMLLFCCAAAAWFLGPRALTAHLLLVPVGCAIALAGSYPHTAALVVQVTVNALVLDVVTLGIFLLRRRVQRLLDETRTLSSTDPLTGLANRRSLVEQAPRIWRQARRSGQRVAALVLDLDHFKLLNDLHGHATGDAVLTEVAAALAATVRPSDVLARIGGEEMVVLGLVSDPDESRRLAERLRSAVAATAAGGRWGVTVSIGAALARPADGDRPGDLVWQLIDRADGAMYEAKQSGRNRVVVASGVAVG
ncbi:GGDEF domain-containing protein [Modestobacter sp. NPDC049651]|uniref:GGDEF domain-containing protein n=1 Tax=unclassified Modestobacter TaxID=2643866 RepID=UPI00340A902A